MTDVKRLLDEATPLPWHEHTYGHRSIRAAAGKVTRSLFRVGAGSFDRELRDTFTDLTYVHDVEEGPAVALTGNGPKQTANAALIVHAVNRLPDYEAAVDALDALMGETGLAGPDGTPDVDAVFDRIEKGRAALRRLRGDA